MIKKIGIPNLISIARILGTILMIYYISVYGLTSRFLIGIIVLFLAATDIADGYIARKYNMKTELGALLDPLADKIFNWGLAISLMVIGEMPLWPLVIGIRDIGAALITEAMYSKRKKIFLTWPAKLKMFFQSAALISTIFFGFGSSGTGLIAQILMIIAVALVFIEIFAVKQKYFN